MTKAFNYAVAKYGNKKALGTREVLGETEEMQSNGKMFKKLALGEYKWINYNETHKTSNSFGKGLRELGQNPGDVIAIYAETRAEWLMSAFGAFRKRVQTNLNLQLRGYLNIETKKLLHGMSSYLILSFDVLLQSEYRCQHSLHQPWGRGHHARPQRNRGQPRRHEPRTLAKVQKNVGTLS